MMWTLVECSWAIKVQRRVCCEFIIKLLFIYDPHQHGHLKLNQILLSRMFITVVVVDVVPLLVIWSSY